MPLITIFIVSSIFIAIFIGLRAGKEIKNKRENFYVAGRKWSWGIVGFALMAQAIDGNATLGSTGLGFDFGFWAAAAMPLGLALSLFLLGKFFAPKLNQMKLMTLADFFKIKYNRKIEIIASLFMLLCFGVLLAGNIAAIAILLMNFIPFHYETLVILTCLAILLYCLRGGIISDLYSDLWQLSLLTVGIVGTFIFILWKFDFTTFFGSSVFTESTDLSQLSTLANGGLINWATIVALGFGNLLAIDFNSRIFAAQSSRAAQKGCYWGGFLTLLIGLPFAFLAPILHFLNVVPSEGMPVLLTFTTTLLPPVIAGFLLAGIIAAALSTIDGAMLSMGNILTQNLLRIQDDLEDQENEESEKTFLYLSRLSLAPIACIAMIFAILLPSPGVLLTVAFDIMFSSLLAPFVFAFYLKKPNITAALYSISTGFLIRFLFWIFTPTSFGVENSILYIPNSFLSANWDGMGTILSPLIALIVYALIYSFSKNSKSSKLILDS
ncbi:MAG: sodium:solute symporter [Candidatus Gracilibacteria bacterium]